MNLFTVFLISSIIFAFGLYYLLADKLKLPTLATSKAALSLSRQSIFKTKRLDTIILEISTKVSFLIHLNDYKKRKLSATLKSAGIVLPPEIWLTRCYVKFAGLLLLIIPTLMLFPIMTPIILFLAIRQLFTELKSADMIALKRRNEIERELPRFVSTVSEELRNTRNVLEILKGYLDSAIPIFRKELEITIADMNSGSHEIALTRFNTRVGSTMLSQVVRGLQAVLRGDDGVVYFELLSHDFDQFELQQLKLDAAKIPPKFNKCTGAVFLCFILLIFLILGMQIVQAYSAFNM